MKDPHRQLADEIYEQIARIGKAVASSKRLELLELLSQTPRTVDSLAREAHLTQANTSQHLQVLRGARLVEATREGTSVRYRLTDDTVAEFFRVLRLLAVTHLAELERLTRQFLKGREVFEPLDRETLAARVRMGEATVVDVRPAEEYQAGHIRGALNVPLAELERRIAELPRDREIVAYCRGPYCVWAAEAASMLREKGFRARHLDDGTLDWRAHGLELSSGTEP
jgi:rhodanese-related sulfurtransferase/DNA-binding transcriptional ArsR family regulator